MFSRAKQCPDYSHSTALPRDSVLVLYSDLLSIFLSLFHAIDEKSAKPNNIFTGSKTITNCCESMSGSIGPNSQKHFFCKVDGEQARLHSFDARHSPKSQSADNEEKIDSTDREHDRDGSKGNIFCNKARRYG
jgi:hypothetical protein